MTHTIKQLVQETNLDNIDDNPPSTIYVYGNNTNPNLNDFFSSESSFSEVNQYYSQPNNFSEMDTEYKHEITDNSKANRRDMFDYLIKYFNYEGETTPHKMCRFLAKEMQCECSDCGGDDSVGECEIEIEYYKHFEQVVEYNDI